MIRHLKHTEINKEKWDACIQHSQNASVFAFSWYLDCVSSGWEALIEGEYEKVFPLTWKKKYGINYLYQPFFTYYWDVYAASPLSLAEKTQFVAAIPEKFRYMDYNLAGEKGYELKGIKTSSRTAQLLDLNKGYTSLRTGYSENLVRNLKKAEKAKFRISENISPALLVSLFKKENQQKLKDFGKKEYQLMEDALQVCIQNKSCIVWGVPGTKNKYCAVAAFLIEDKRVLYFKGTSDEEGRKNGAMHWIMDAVIRSYSGKEFIYDFGGSNVPGVAKFNHHFGAEDYTYFNLKKNALPGIVKWIKK